MENNNQVKKRRLEGIVTSDKMNKTVVVTVTRTTIHPKYLKRYKVSNKFKAHSENNAYKIGDKVTIEETRPISKDKRWTVIGKLTQKRSKL